MADHKPMTDAELRAARALCDAEARFVEASRTLFPRLLDEVDSLRAEVRRLEQRLTFGPKIDPNDCPLEAAKILSSARVAELRRDLAAAVERHDRQLADKITAKLRRYGEEV